MDKMNKEKEKSIGKKIKDLIKGNVKMYLCWLFLLGLGKTTSIHYAFQRKRKTGLYLLSFQYSFFDKQG